MELLRVFWRCLVTPVWHAEWFAISKNRSHLVKRWDLSPRAFPEDGSPVGRRWQRCAQGPRTCRTPPPAALAVPSLAGRCAAGREQLPEAAGCLALGSQLPASLRPGAGAASRPCSVVRTARPHRYPPPWDHAGLLRRHREMTELCPAI